MGWDHKARGRKSGYYYLSVRTPDGVKKVYVGRGEAAHIAAALIEQRRRERQAAREATRAEVARTADADRLADELYDWAKLLAAAWLTAAGCRYHRGTWRTGRDRRNS